MPISLLVLILLVFLGIPTLIRLGFFSVEWRLSLLFLVFVAFAIWGFSTLSPLAMGFTNADLVRGLLPWSVATLLMLLGMLVAAVILRQKHAEGLSRDLHFLFLFIPISAVQQFIYQSVLLQKLLLGLDPWLAIAICGLCFGYMHTIFPRRLHNFMLATLGGILFSSLFYFYPNFLLAAASHMILNFVAVYLGFFTLLTSDGKPRATRLPFARLRKTTPGDF